MKSVSDVIKYQNDKENVVISVATSLKNKHISILIYSELQTELYGLLKEYCMLDYQRMTTGSYSLRGSFSYGFDETREQAIQKFKDYVKDWNTNNIKLGKLRNVYNMEENKNENI